MFRKKHAYFNVAEGRNGARTRCLAKGWLAGTTSEFYYAWIYSDSLASGDFIKTFIIILTLQKEQKDIVCASRVEHVNFVMFIYKQLYL